jgi:hypothetical protein
MRSELAAAERRIQALEAKLSIIQDDDQYMSLEDFGRSIYQDEWNKVGCSPAVIFTSPVSFTCLSIEEDHSHNAMPGVRGQMSMQQGLYSQSSWCQGGGYCLVGMVGSQEEKDALTDDFDWSKLPLMKTTPYLGGKQTYTLIVDG